MFLSFANPQDKSYGDCFLVKKIDGNNKIVSKYFLKREDPAEMRWQFHSGNINELIDQNIPSINAERYLEPTADKILIELNKKKQGFSPKKPNQF